MKVMGASVLVFEAIVVGLFIPVAYFNGFVADGIAAVWAGGALVLLCLVAAALVRRPFGVALGWVVQALILATGVFVPMMIVLGGLFTALWWAAIHYGRRADALAAGRTAATARTTPSAPGSRSQ
jgi:hypothetical protein